MTSDIHNHTRPHSLIEGGLLLAATLMALLLMMHHPTSLDGPDDGLLLSDWSNRLVHGAMILCILGLMVGGSALSRCLDERHLSVRMGAKAFTFGMTALIGAGLVTGFVVPRIVAAAIDPAAARLQSAPFSALNQVLAVFGMMLVSAACALWAVRMLRLGLTMKIAGASGIVLAGLAVGWLVLGHGAFGLYPATIALTAFAAWSLIVATQLIRRAI